MNLILLDPGEVTTTGEVTLTDGRARHVREVLQATPGLPVRVGIIDGALGTGTVTSIDAVNVALRCTFGAPPPRPRVDLLLALPRPKVMRRLWAQLSALGVGRIILTNAERVERNYFDTHVISPECYRPLLLEGLQQARDTRVPPVSVHRQFRKLVEDELATLSDATIRIVAEPGATMTIRDALRAGRDLSVGRALSSLDSARDDPEYVEGSGPPGERVLLAIGPEGGWNEFELGLLEAHGFQRVSMGARTLRSDTACVALLATVICDL